MKKNKIFLFFGPPGSGKGSLSSLCVQHFGWKHVSTGDLCRAHIKLGTEIGKHIKAVSEQGRYVSDEIIADMVANWIIDQKEVSQDFILDGYPRTRKQAEMLDKLMQERLQNFQLVLVKLNINSDLLADRIVNRVSCSGADCGQIYSMSASSKARPKIEMVCDKCDGALIKRSDDSLEALKLRLQAYYLHEQEVIDFYIDKGLDIEMLNGDQSIQDVFEDFKIVLQKYDY